MRLRAFFACLGLCVWLGAQAQVPCCDLAGDVAQGLQLSFPDTTHPCLVQVCLPQFFDDACVDMALFHEPIWGDTSLPVVGPAPLQLCYQHEYTSSGTYTIVLPVQRFDPVTLEPCGEAALDTTITLSCDTSPGACCADPQAFQSLIDQGWQVSVDGCSVEICAPQFDDDCYVLTTMGPDWGDGSVTLPALSPLADCYAYTYAGDGTYIVSGVICEVDASGNLCWCAPMTTTVVVDACDSPPDTCCTDLPGFQSLIDQGWQVSVDSCTVQVCAPQFATDDCYWLSTADLDWGDGSGTLPVLSPLDSCYTHTYTSDGVYDISGVICELGLHDSLPCWCEAMHVTVAIDGCGTPPDTCCADRDAFLDKVHQGWEVYVYGHEVVICAPQFDSLCHLSMWTQPDWGDGSAGLPEVSPLQPCYTHVYDSCGTYRVRLTVCEHASDGCICWCEPVEVLVEVACPPGDLCCADTLAFYDRVVQGYEMAVDDCCVKLHPAALDSCDQVTQWCIDGLCVDGPFIDQDEFVWCFAQSGHHEICFTAELVDPLTGQVCAQATYCDTMYVDCAPACACGPWDLQYSVVTADIPPVSIHFGLSCGDTIFYDPQWLQFVVSGMAHCQPSPTWNCVAEPLEWKLVRPHPLDDLAGALGGNPFNLAFPPDAFEQPGLYRLLLYSKCGDELCACEIVIVVAEEDLCCTDEQAFYDRVQQGFDWDHVPGSPCCIVVEPAALTDCDLVGGWSWGDGQSAVGPFVPDEPVVHCYAQGGTYEICMSAVEVDPATGAVCWEAAVCDTLELSTCPSDPCGCSWSPVSIGTPAVTWAAECGDTLVLDLPCPTDEVVVAGVVSCVSDAPTGGPCDDPAHVTWVLHRPDSLPALEATVPGPHYTIVLTDSMLAAPGLYTLELYSTCDTVACSCRISFLYPCGTPTNVQRPEWTRGLRLVPNPAAQQAYVLVPAEAVGQLTGWRLQLLSAQGQRLQVLELGELAASRIVVELEGLPDAVYELVLFDAEGRPQWSHQLVKQE